MGQRVGGGLRVALISTPFVPVPPVQYGGTELIVGELVDGLGERGVEVTLFAAGDSHGGFHRPCPVEAWFPESTWPPSLFKELEHAAFSFGRLLARPGAFDLVHAHVPTFIPLASLLDLPVVYTLHHPLDEELCRLYRAHPAVTYVSISERQRQLCGPFARGAVVHHGLDPARYRLGPVRPDAVAFLGRLSQVKGPHRAIDVAGRAGLRIRVGGRPHEEDALFFASELQARLEQPHVEYLGELSHEPKVELLSTARAVLFPISWEEPFGLVAIEAMLCGAPVVAFGHGAVPEIVDEGLTGFIARDEEEMATILAGPASPAAFDRRRCREHAARRFGAARMVDDYLALYRVAARRAEAESAAAPSPTLHG